MAIFFMLGVTAVMLAAFASFFIYLIRRKRLFADDVDSVPAHERTV
jgi:maltodextrin utilization protein YvdJ